MRLVQISSLILGIAGAAIPGSVLAENFETWTSADGTQQLHATPVAFDGDLILFEKSDGGFRWGGVSHFCDSDQSRLAELGNVATASEVTLQDAKANLPATAVRIGGTETYDVIKTDNGYKRFPVGKYVVEKSERLKTEYVQTGWRANQRRASHGGGGNSPPMAVQSPTYTAPQCDSTWQSNSVSQCYSAPQCYTTPQCGTYSGVQNVCGEYQGQISYSTMNQDVIPQSPLANRPPMQITIPYTVQSSVNGQLVQETRSMTRNMTQQETINYLLDKTESAEQRVGDPDLGEEIRKLDAEVFGRTPSKDRQPALIDRVKALEDAP